MESFQTSGLKGTMFGILIFQKLTINNEVAHFDHANLLSLEIEWDYPCRKRGILHSDIGWIFDMLESAMLCHSIKYKFLFLMSIWSAVELFVSKTSSHLLDPSVCVFIFLFICIFGISFGFFLFFIALPLWRFWNQDWFQSSWISVYIPISNVIH